MDLRRVHELQLAVEEHLTNITNHAFDDASNHDINISGVIRDGMLRVQIIDDGKPFNPTEHPSPQLDRPLGERALGGLGIHMMRQSTDGMTYERALGRNILTLCKRIT